MRISERSAPNPPMIDAKNRFDGCIVTKNPTAKGVENPKEKSMPAINIPQ